MSSVLRHALTAAVVALPVIPRGLSAQAPDSARAGHQYSTLLIGASGVTPPGSGALSSRWKPGAGAGIEVYTPFHVGELGAVARTMRYGSRSTDQPSFRAYIIGLDWRFPIARSAAVRPAVSVTAGDFLTVYDGEQPKGAGKESEIFIGATAAVAVRVVGQTYATLGIAGMQVLTSTPIRLAYATVGVAQALATPSWLRWVLQ